MLARICLFLGILSLLFGGYLLFERTNPNRLSFQSYIEHPVQDTNRTIHPARIAIPSLSIDLPVIAAEYNGATWDTTTRGISYLITSPLPGESGNSILYGHNWSNLLGKLPKIKPGDEITVSFTSGEKKQFTVTYTAEVLPTDDDILQPSKDKRLTLYTCIGFFDEKRFVAVAILDEPEESDQLSSSQLVNP